MIEHMLNGQILSFEIEANDTIRDIASMTNMTVTELIREINKICKEHKAYTKDDLMRMPMDELYDLIPISFQTDEEKNEESPVLLKKKFHSQLTSDIDKKYKGVTNQACYAVLAANDTGSVSVIPKSNGALRINCSDKSQAEAYLRAFERKLVYATNSVDFFSVGDFYRMLKVNVSDEIMTIADQYGWPTVSMKSSLANYVSSSVTKSTDDSNCYGFTICKRAHHIN